ncbi:MAG: hypothetical protein ACRCS9_09080 [Hyphomicrobium sp.]
MRDRAALKALAVEVSDASLAKPERLAVTDLVLVLSDATGGRAMARLLIVAGGRLYRDTHAACSAPVDGVERCLVDCEGGAFLIRRAPSGDAALVLDLADGSGKTPSGAAGFTLSACDVEQSGDVALVSRSGPTAVTVPLAGE